MIYPYLGLIKKEGGMLFTTKKNLIQCVLARITLNLNHKADLKTVSFFFKPCPVLLLSTNYVEGCFIMWWCIQLYEPWCLNDWYKPAWEVACFDVPLMEAQEWWAFLGGPSCSPSASPCWKGVRCIFLLLFFTWSTPFAGPCEGWRRTSVKGLRLSGYRCHIPGSVPLRGHWGKCRNVSKLWPPPSLSE